MRLPRPEKSTESLIVCAACHELPAVLHRLDAPLAKLCEPCYLYAIKVVGAMVAKYGGLPPSLTADEVKAILEDEPAAGRR